MTKRFIIFVTAMVFVSTLHASPKQDKEPLALVPELDVQRYSGLWYEIARLPHWFEKDLTDVTAEYTIREDGKISVLNSGRKGGADGEPSDIDAVAWIPDPARPAALKVRFFWPFSSDYLVFALDEENYQWALVGNDNREFLWFLSRTPEISPALLEEMKRIAEDQGYDLRELILVPHGS